MIIGIDASRAYVNQPAGPEYYSWHLIRSLAKIDKNNRYLLYLRPGQRAKFKLPKNFALRHINLPYLWTQVGLAWETLRRPPDILFIPAHTLPLLTRILRPSLPMVVTIHGLEGKYLPQSGLFLSHIYRNLAISWAVRLATALIAVSRYTKHDIIKTYKQSLITYKQSLILFINPYKNISNKIIVVHEGVDFRHFSQKVPAAKVYQFAKKYNKYLLFVGTIQPRKNLVRLIEAFAQIRARFASDSLNLVIAGKRGWLYDDILAAPKRFGVGKSVKFIGRVKESELPALYRGAAVFILPSLTEGFGLPILEAQAAGTPVIAAKTGALPEVAGGGAVLVDPTKVDAIYRVMVRILTDKKLRQKLVVKGRQNARKFSWETTAYKTRNFLAKIAEKSSISA